MRPLRYSINVTLDGCCDHREIPTDENLHRHAAQNLARADALLFGRVTYEMMEAAWRPPARALDSVQETSTEVSEARQDLLAEQCQVVDGVVVRDVAALAHH